MGKPPATIVPRVIGHVGLWTSVAACLLCALFFAVGTLRAGSDTLPVGVSTTPWILHGLLFGPVAVLGIWLFAGFLKLPDWGLAPEMPLGMKLLGHLGRVLGTLGATACVVLAALTVVIPDSVPPRPPATVVRLAQPAAAPDAAATAGAANQLLIARGTPRPGLAALYVLGILACALVRLLGSAVSEARRWARVGALLGCGGALVVLVVCLVLNATVWRASMAAVPLGVGAGLCAILFVGLLVYFTLPRVVDAFEAYGL